jgi:hypothetical protein
MATIPTVHQELSDEQLLEALENLKGQAEYYQGEANRAEFILSQRMAERGSTIIPSDIYECQIKTDPKWDYSAFRELQNIFTIHDFSTCFTPEHTVEKVVGISWNTTTVRALCKRYGAKAQAIYNRARMKGRETLTFKRK